MKDGFGGLGEGKWGLMDKMRSEDWFGSNRCFLFGTEDFFEIMDW
jgi:hypothetical protein